MTALTGWTKRTTYLKCEPDNDSNTDEVKEAEDLADKNNTRRNSPLANKKPLDIIKELEEFPLLEAADMEDIFAEFGLTTAEIFEQVFKYFQFFQIFMNIRSDHS